MRIPVFGVPVLDSLVVRLALALEGEMPRIRLYASRGMKQAARLRALAARWRGARVRQYRAWLKAQKRGKPAVSSPPTPISKTP